MNGSVHVSGWGLWIQRVSDAKGLVRLLNASRCERVESAKHLVALSDALDEAALVEAIVAAKPFVDGDE